MIIGCGIDLCELARMRNLLARHSRLPKRLLSASELEAAGSSSLDEAVMSRLLAKRFAAKEALVKAMGGAAGLGFGDASVVHNSNGRPEFVFSSRLSARLPEDARVHLSISDERGHAIAMVIIET